jgi:hypothetical protein
VMWHGCLCGISISLNDVAPRFKPSEMNHHRHADVNLVPLSLSLSLVDEVTSREKLVYISYRQVLLLYTIPSVVVVPRTLSRNRTYSSAGHMPSASFDRASVDKTTTASVNCDSWSKMADVLLQKVGKRKWNSLPDSVFQ